MPRTVLAVPGTIAFLALVAVPSAAFGQKMEAGKWTGTVTPPGGETAQVTYDVTVAGDSIAIRIEAGEHGTFDAAGTKLVADTLTFSFTPGPTVNCTLKRRPEDRAFAGACVDPDGGAAQIVMIPPKQQPAPALPSGR
jgi:hypothetical protein